MARARGISVVVSGNTAPLRKSLQDASKELSAFGKAQAAWSQASSLAYGVVGTAAAQFAISSVKAALDDQKSQALLAQQLRATTGARQAQIDGVEDYITKTMLATNITDDQLRPALAQLVRVTGSAAEAQKLLTVATDVSIGGQRDLSSVVMALGKAYQGNYGALQKLGIQVNETAVAAEGFSAVTDQLTGQFGGSAQAATETLAGRVENLGVRLGELKETIGGLLLPVVDDATTKLLEFTKAVETKSPKDLTTSIYGIGSGLADLAQTITGIGIGKGLSPLNWWLNRNDKDARTLADTYRMLSDVIVTATNQANAAQALEDQAEAAAKAEREVGYLKDQYKLFSDVTLQQVEDQKKLQRAGGSARKSTENDEKTKRREYRETAKSLRQDLAGALDDARKALQDAKNEADDFGKSLAFSFGVSLAGAYDKAADAEQTYTDALKARGEAYAALDVAKQGDDLNAYLKAVQDVATAEQAVTTAQAARVTPAAAFADQVAAAKTFGTNLKTLIGQGLGQAGLQQLLDLGPTAGAEVTKALLEGTAGFTVGGLNESLAALSEVQGGLASGITAALAPKGAITAAQSQVDMLSSASIGAPGVGQGFVININAGVGDPVEIGRQVKAVLGDYDNRAGSLIVQGGKKKGKKR